jgi:lysophospholipid acyltransferase (LPLAT)-like uncharacterized protein
MHLLRKFLAMHLLIWLIGTLLGSTWRVSVDDPCKLDPFNDRGTGRIYCFWHSRLLALTYIFRNTGKTAVVSQSKDGQLAAGAARRWRHGIIFGSSSRGGSSAMRESIRLLELQQCLVITPDGPRGPRERVKPGVAQIAIAAGAPVIPVAISVNRCWRLKSWDRFIVPKPFARIRVTIGNPLSAPANPATDEQTEQFRHQIDESLQCNDLMAA